MGKVQTNKAFKKKRLKGMILELRVDNNLKGIAEKLNQAGYKTMTNRLWSPENVRSFISHNIGYPDSPDEGIVSVIIYAKTNNLRASQILEIMKKHNIKGYTRRDINYIIGHHFDIDNVKIIKQYQKVYDDI